MNANKPIGQAHIPTVDASPPIRTDDDIGDILFEIAVALETARQSLSETLAAHPEAAANILPIAEKLGQLKARLIAAQREAIRSRQSTRLFDSTGRREDDGFMDDRIGILEQDVATLKTDVATLKTDVATLKTDVATLKTDVAALKTDVAIIRSNYVSKEDLNKALLSMTWRIFGFASLLCGVVYYIARYVH